MLLKKTLLLFFLFYCSILCAQQLPENQLLDSVYFYRALSDNEDYNLNEREAFVRKAIEFSKKTKEDSIILKSKRQLATLFLRQFAVDSLFDLNHENLKLAK